LPTCTMPHIAVLKDQRRNVSSFPFPFFFRSSYAAGTDAFKLKNLRSLPFKDLIDRKICEDASVCTVSSIPAGEVYTFTGWACAGFYTSISCSAFVQLRKAKEPVVKDDKKVEQWDVLFEASSKSAYDGDTQAEAASSSLVATINKFPKCVEKKK
jgi:hypothetical protein